MQERVKVLSDIVHELQRARDENIPHMNAINQLSDRIVSEEKLTVSNRVSCGEFLLKYFTLCSSVYGFMIILVSNTEIVTVVLQL